MTDVWGRASCKGGVGRSTIHSTPIVVTPKKQIHNWPGLWAGEVDDD